MGIEVNLRMELERVKIANNINKYSKSEMKDCEETRKSLSPGTRSFRRKRKQLRPTHQWNWNEWITKDNFNKYSELKMKDCEQEKESLSSGTRSFRRKWKQLRPMYHCRICSWLAAVLNKAVSMEEIQPVMVKCHYTISSSSEGWVKVDLGKWSSRIRKLIGGPEQLYAIKAIKKRRNTSSIICEIMSERKPSCWHLVIPSSRLCTFVSKIRTISSLWWSIWVELTSRKNWMR